MQEQVTLWANALWQGFSLALVISMLARVAVAGEERRELRLRLTLAERVFIAFFCFVGLSAAALSGGTPHGVTATATAIAFAGVAGGIWIALRVIRKVE
jgi:hypothetical protein